MERLSVDVYTAKARTDCFAYDSNSGECTALREIQCQSGRCKFYKSNKNTGGIMIVDFEKVLKEKLSEETFSIISSSEKEFEDWLDRLKRDAERCGELYRELESVKNAATRGE